MIILAIISFLGFACGSLLIALLIIGYRGQVKRITQAANRNAGYWAEAESKLRESQIIAVQLDAVLKVQNARCAELSRIAHEALQIAHHKEFGAVRPPHWKSGDSERPADFLADDEWPEEFH